MALTWMGCFCGFVDLLTPLEIADIALASVMGVNTFCYCHISSMALRPSNIFFGRALWNPRQSSIRPPPLVPTLPAQSRLHFHSSITVSKTILTDSMNEDVRRGAPTELEGLSGHRYKIERVLQDKGSLLGRVILATYVGYLNQETLSY